MSLTATLPNRRIVSFERGSSEGVISLARVEDGTQATHGANVSGVSGVAISHDQRRVAAATGDNVVISDAQSGATTATLRGHGGKAVCAAFSPEGALIASGGEDAIVHVWRGPDGAHLLSMRGHTAPVRCVAFNPDGTRAASGSDDHFVRVWDTHSGKNVWATSGHTARVWCFTFSFDGGRVASANADGTVRLWNALDGSSVFCMRGHTGAVYSVAFSPDGTHLVSAGVDASVMMWKAATGAHVRTMKGHASRVFSVSVSPDGACIMSGDQAGAVCVWNFADGARLRSHKATRPVWCVSASTGLLAAVQSSGLVERFEEGTALRCPFPPTCLGASADGALVAAGGGDGNVAVWSTARGGDAALLDGNLESAVTRVFFSQVGQRVVAEGAGGKVAVFDAQPGMRCTVISGEAPALPVLSPRESRLACCVEGGVGIFDVESGKELGRADGHPSRVTHVEFSRQGALVTLCGQRRLKVWGTDYKLVSSTMDFEGDFSKAVNGELGVGESVTMAPESVPTAPSTPTNRVKRP